jgi:hypothetical protein
MARQARRARVCLSQMCWANLSGNTLSSTQPARESPSITTRLWHALCCIVLYAPKETER